MGHEINGATFWCILWMATFGLLLLSILTNCYQAVTARARSHREEER